MEPVSSGLPIQNYIRMSLFASIMMLDGRDTTQRPRAVVIVVIQAVS